MRLVLDEWQGGVKIGGLKSPADSELVKLLQNLEDVRSEYGLEMNYRKTIAMIVDWENNNQPNKLMDGWKPQSYVRIIWDR